MDADALLNILKKFATEDLKSEDKEVFEVSSYELVLHDINDIQSRREQTKKLINMKRIHPFLSGMAQLEKVFGTIELQHGSKLMAHVWGSIRFLLKVYKYLALLDCILPNILT